jgi:hypothetical protein
MDDSHRPNRLWKNHGTVLFRWSYEQQQPCIWLGKAWYPELRLRQIIITDNALCHKSFRIWEIIRNIHCKLCSLPSSSQDLNPIEAHSGSLKNILSYLWHHILTFLTAFLSLLRYFFRTEGMPIFPRQAVNFGRKRRIFWSITLYIFWILRQKAVAWKSSAK